MKTPVRARLTHTGRVGGPVIVALVVLLALVVALAATWLGRRIVRHDRKTEAVRPESTQPTLSELEAPYAPIASEPPAGSTRLEVELPSTDPDPAALGPDPVGHVVWGYVLGGTEETPLGTAESAAVGFTDALGNSQVARAGANGAYSMAGLENGRWYVRVTAREWKADEAVLDLVPDVPTVRQDFLLAPRPTVRVKVLAPDGRPFWDAWPNEKSGPWVLMTLAVATRDAPGERFEGVRGSPNNRFGVGSWWLNGMMGVQLPKEYWGVVRLWEDPPVYLSLVVYHEVVETQRVEPGQDEVTFTLDPAALEARLGGVELELVDADDGTPRQGALVLLSIKGQGPPRRETDAVGRIRIEGQAAGLYDLRIQARDKAALHLEVDVPRGRVLNLGTLALRDAMPIRGRAVDPAGNGVAVQIRACAVPAPGELPEFVNYRFGGRADGTFEITTLEAGRWLLHVKDSRRGRLRGNAAELMAPNLVVDSRAGPVEDLLVHMQRVACVIARWTGPDYDGLRLRFFDEDDLLRQTGGFYSPAPTRVELLQGTWHLEVVDASGAAVADRSFTLGAEPVVLELGPGG